ncbi:hypothetical protein [Rhodococcus opacus]|uniref:hypothetical protein n=1 Tax=Rhodococcus opacus TaxID=37919 RepID=UPI00223682A1|nr:hypothetical protein [Rhodococcus opacus]UZG56245.1 hypothetical protein ONE62_02670 [Rhodococcus opacus]
MVTIAWQDQDELFSRKPHLRIYESRVLMVVLCQGGAQHYLDHINGVKDLDVYTFYASHPEREYPARRRGTADFGASQLGRHPDDHGYDGRRVDLMGRSLKVSPDHDPVDAVQSYLMNQSTSTAWHLSQKAVIALDPPSLFGTTIWPSASSAGDGNIGSDA